MSDTTATDVQLDALRAKLATPAGRIVVKIGDREYDTGSLMYGEPDPCEPEEWHGVLSAIASWVCGNAVDPEEARYILRDAV